MQSFKENIGERQKKKEEGGSMDLLKILDSANLQNE